MSTFQALMGESTIAIIPNLDEVSPLSKLPIIFDKKKRWRLGNYSFIARANGTLFTGECYVPTYIQSFFLNLIHHIGSIWNVVMHMQQKQFCQWWIMDEDSLSNDENAHDQDVAFHRAIK